MSAFNPVIDSTKILTKTFITSPSRLDSDSAAVFAALNVAGYDVAAYETHRTEDPSGRNDLLTVTVVGKSRV